MYSVGVRNGFRPVERCQLAALQIQQLYVPSQCLNFAPCLFGEYKPAIHVGGVLFSDRLQQWLYHLWYSIEKCVHSAVFLLNPEVDVIRKLLLQPPICGQLPRIVLHGNIGRLVVGFLHLSVFVQTLQPAFIVLH
ncbi:hypothetical protein D3C75_942800 [compost metagenome]